MTLRDVVDRADGLAWLLVRGMQLALVGISGYALLTGNLGLLVNGLIPLAITFLPAALRRSYDYEMNGGLALWIASAAFLHAVGALGPYQTLPWYDQVTHTLSATLVAGAGYAVVTAIDRNHDGVTIPPRLLFVFILLFVLAFGVVWEIAEFASGGLSSLVGGEPVLAQYGMDDVVMDLTFNAVGALLVALWGTGYFDGLSRFLTRRGGRAERDR